MHYGFTHVLKGRGQLSARASGTVNTGGFVPLVLLALPLVCLNTLDAPVFKLFGINYPNPYCQLGTEFPLSDWLVLLLCSEASETRIQHDIVSLYLQPQLCRGSNRQAVRQW